MLRVTIRIQPDAEELQAFADTPPHVRGVLPDTTGEDEGVQPPKRGGQSAEELLRLVAEEGDSLGSPRIVRLSTEQVAHVHARLRDPEKAGPLVDQLAHLRRTQPLLLEQIEEHTGVQV